MNNACNLPTPTILTEALSVKRISRTILRARSTMTETSAPASQPWILAVAVVMTSMMAVISALIETMAGVLRSTSTSSPRPRPPQVLLMLPVCTSTCALRSVRTLSTVTSTSACTSVRVMRSLLVGAATAPMKRLERAKAAVAMENLILNNGAGVRMRMVGRTSE